MGKKGEAMFFGDKSYIRKFANIIYDAIEELKAGNKSYLRIVYQAIALEDRDLVQSAGQAIGMYLKSKTAKDMIALGERFREYTSLEWTIHWNTIDIKKKKTWFALEEEYICALIIGSFHPNGYFRETCAKELYNYPNTLGCMLLRTNDWVEEIREIMFPLALQRIKSCSVLELFQSMQYMEKLSRSERIGCSNIELLSQAFYDRMEQTLPDIPLDKIRYHEFATRKFIYRLLTQKKILDIPQINYLLEHEKHSFCKQVLMIGILQYYKCSPEQIEGYLKDKSYVVRRRALEYKYSITKDYWIGLETMLLDQSKGVRELAAYIIRHHSDIHILNYYITHLQDKNPISAIEGIGENGGKETGKLLLPFLESPVKNVVCAALKALAKTIGIDGYDIYLKYLANQEAAVSKAAYHAIGYNNISYGVERLYPYCREYGSPHVKKYALLLLCKENSWNRLPYLLNLYGEKEYEVYKDRIWQAIVNRDMYGTISKQQAKKINWQLERNKHLLPEGVMKEILFDMKFLVEG